MHDKSIQRTNISLRAGIAAEGLGKRFGELWALRDFDLEVPAGSVLGLLGHNGAGKTTAIRILTTLSQPTTGTAYVAGHDVVAVVPGLSRARARTRPEVERAELLRDALERLHLERAVA